MPIRLLILGVCLGTLVSGCGGGGNPRPDLLLVSTRDGDYAIYAMNADGSRQKRLTKTTVDASSPKGLFFQTDPAWSPNGRVVMFFRDPGGSAGPTLFTVDVTGRNEQRVPSPSYASDPAWSPLLR